MQNAEVKGSETTERGCILRDMTTREQARALLDRVPDSELEPVVAFLASHGEEPWTAKDEAAVAEANEDLEAGRTLSHEEIKAEFGIE